MGQTEVGKTFNERSWDSYLENHQDAERDVVAMSFLPVTASEISDSYESLGGEAPPVIQGLPFDEFAGDEPRKRSKSDAAERREFQDAVIFSSGLIDEPGIWREELRDTKNVRAFKHVVANYMTYRMSSCVRVANLSDEAGKTQFKPNVAANRLDFYADVSICVRKAVSPSLYRVWDAFFVRSNGKNAEKIPAHTFAEMAERAGELFLAHGLHPIQNYFKPTLCQPRKQAA